MWHWLEKKMKQAHLVPAGCMSACVCECVCVWGECSPKECLYTEGFTLWQIVRIDCILGNWPINSISACKLSHSSHVRVFATLMDCSPPDSCLSMGFSKQEYWSGLPCPSLGDLPDPRDWTCISLSFPHLLFDHRQSHPEWYAFVVVQSCPTLCDPHEL